MLIQLEHSIEEVPTLHEQTTEIGTAPLDGDLPASLPKDREWIEDTERLEANIFRRAALIAALGGVIFAAFALLSYLSRIDSDESPTVDLNIDSTTAVASLGTFLAASTLLTPIAFSLEHRMRDHNDKRIAQFARLISSSALVIGVFASTIAFAFLFSSAPIAINAPTLAACLIITGFICLFSSITAESLHLGAELSNARQENWRLKQETRRKNAAFNMVPLGIRRRKPNLAFGAAALCAIFAGATSLSFVLIYGDDGPPFPIGITILGGVTIVITFLSTYFGQLQLRRGELLNSALILFACGLWLLTLSLATLSSQSAGVRYSGTILATTSAAMAIILFALPAPNARPLKNFSIRLAVHHRLLDDVYKLRTPLRAHPESRFSIWYKRAIGALNNYSEVLDKHGTRPSTEGKRADDKM